MREWDKFTIQHEPITSIDLMERAARACTAWIESQPWKNRTFSIFCGMGNNGGDGLAIARHLLTDGYQVSIYIFDAGKKGTADFSINLQRLNDTRHSNIHYIRTREDFPLINTSEILVDALFGYGLNKPLEGLVAELVQYLNHSRALVVSIDLPSGMFADKSSVNGVVAEADYTLTFQAYKTGLLVQENEDFMGEVHIMNIGLLPEYLNTGTFNSQLVTGQMAGQVYKSRSPFAHKGAYGHALLVAGSYGKMGAAVLAAKACIHTGSGLLTCAIPSSGYDIMQISVPEAMVMADRQEHVISTLPGEIEKYDVIGIGPGLGTADETCNLISFICRRYHKPLVIDADGLNCLSQKPELLHQLPALSVLTPHPREFDRLFGEHQDDFSRMETARNKAAELNVIIVLKGHHTLTVTPEGKTYFNSTGNAGMAKGGSGDVLTGIITALRSQHYEPSVAAFFGVYLHGLAGDFAASTCSMESMSASDIITNLSKAFLQLRHDVNEWRGN